MFYARYGDSSKLILKATLFLGLVLLMPTSSIADEKIECAKKEAKTVVHAAAKGLAALVEHQPNTKTAIELIQQYVDPIRFYPDNSGYFYVYNLDCINIAHAIQKNLVGKDLTDHKDSRGNYVIRMLAEKAKEGGGFVEYWWVKPGAKGEHRKIGYVEPIVGTDYFIGTGVYLE
jgi:signal transduction histidine kinase